MQKLARGFRLVELLVLLCLIPFLVDGYGESASGATANDGMGLSKIVGRLSTGAEPVTIVCFGDSITGLYYHTGGRRAYADMLGIALGRVYPSAKIQMVNAGVSGNTTRQGLARLDRDVLEHHPSLVTVMFGMNDVVGVPIEEYRSNLTRIIARCRAGGAEVVLCTPNSVFETPERPGNKVAQYAQVVREVAREHQVPVADCHQAYESLRAQDAREWSLLMSDEIHPNMDGHKLFAAVIAAAVSGKDVRLADVEAPTPAIPKTLGLLRSGKQIKVLAMPPYDKMIEPTLRQISPDAKCDVTIWPVEGQSLSAIEEAAKKVRGMNMDLVIVAVPAAAAASTQSDELFIRSYSWVLNWSLSFSSQEWDCVCIPPSVTTATLGTDDTARDALMRRLIKAQDLGMVSRHTGETLPPDGLLQRWFEQEAKKGLKMIKRTE